MSARPEHARSRAGLAILDATAVSCASAAPGSFDEAVADATVRVVHGDVGGAAALVARALAAAPPGATVWRLPVEPLPQGAARADAWAAVMAMVRERAT